MSWEDDRLERLRGFVATGSGSVRRLGRYLLLDLLGEGGTGVVFRARDEELGREVALKMLKTAHAFSPQQVERFQREGRNAARLRHPSIVTVHDVGRDGDVLYFTMELVSGKPFDPRGDREAAVRVLEKVARAVQHAHEQKVLHRDLKPANILVDAAREPHLLDFGLSRDLASPSELTQSGTLFGTPGYMAPEQVSSRPDEADARSDVYSLGAILYEILAGRRAFEAPTLGETIHKLATERPPVPPGPADLAAVALAAMERDPAKRTATAGEFADDLARYLARQPVRARRPRRVRGGAVAAAAAILMAFGAILSFPAPRAVAMIPDLVGRWTFDDGGAGGATADESGRGQEGRLGGRPTPAAGRTGQGLRFHGRDDHVALPSTPDLNRLQAGSYTVSVWFQPEDLPSDEIGSYALVVKKGWHEGLRYTREGKFVMDHWLEAAGCMTAGAWDRKCPPRRWYHVAGVVDPPAGTVQIYVDGRLEGTSRWSPGAPARDYGTTPWRIGVAVPGGEKYACPARGILDDVRLYSRALTPGEVLSLFTSP